MFIFSNENYNRPANITDPNVKNTTYNSNDRCLKFSMQTNFNNNQFFFASNFYNWNIGGWGNGVSSIKIVGSTHGGASWEFADARNDDSDRFDIADWSFIGFEWSDKLNSLQVWKLYDEETNSPDDEDMWTKHHYWMGGFNPSDMRNLKYELDEFLEGWIVPRYYEYTQFVQDFVNE